MEAARGWQGERNEEGKERERTTMMVERLMTKMK